MNGEEISTWFDGYNDTFGACGRGERPVDDVLAYYDDNLLVTTDEAVLGPAGGAALVLLREQFEQMQAADYDHTVILRREVTVLNAHTALFEGDFSRRRADGSEVSAFTVTYLILRRDGATRISSLAMHSPRVTAR